ncbi:MAG: STAS domain-containing protein [Terrimicrobiaceae bacterium]
MASELQTKVDEGVLQIILNLPRLDASSSASLKKQLAFDLDPSVQRAEVDLGEVQFIDSSGIGVLLSIYRKLPQEGADVTLRNVRAGVQAVLELLRLHRIFKVE